MDWSSADPQGLADDLGTTQLEYQGETFDFARRSAACR
jgi:hypothetical protein